MAVELAPHGITVNGIAPGYFKTELTAPLVNDAAFTSWLVARTPARRWGRRRRAAPAAVFLASDGAASSMATSWWSTAACRASV